MNTLNNGISELYYNEEIRTLDIKDHQDIEKINVENIILELLTHGAFKSFNSGESFTGSVNQLIADISSMQYEGNLIFLLQNQAKSTTLKDQIEEEILLCLKPGIDLGYFSLVDSNPVVLDDSDNYYIIKLSIIVNKKRENLIFSYNKATGDLA